MVVIVRPGSTNTVVVDRARTAAVTAQVAEAMRATDARHVVVVEDEQRSVSVGSPGPQGAPGAPGSDVVPGTAAEALGGHRMVRGARDALTYATNTDASHADDIQGLTLGAAAAGAGVLLQRAGDVTEQSWSWTPESPVFLGTNGQLTQTPPDDSAAFTLCVGFAATPTTLVLRFEAPIYNED